MIDVNWMITYLFVVLQRLGRYGTERAFTGSLRLIRYVSSQNRQYYSVSDIIFIEFHVRVHWNTIYCKLHVHARYFSRAMDMLQSKRLKLCSLTQK